MFTETLAECNTKMNPDYTQHGGTENTEDTEDTEKSNTGIYAAASSDARHVSLRRTPTETSSKTFRT